MSDGSQRPYAKREEIDVTLKRFWSEFWLCIMTLMIKEIHNMIKLIQKYILYSDEWKSFKVFQTFSLLNLVLCCAILIYSYNRILIGFLLGKFLGKQVSMVLVQILTQSVLGLYLVSKSWLLHILGRRPRRAISTPVWSWKEVACIHRLMVSLGKQSPRCSGRSVSLHYC